MSTKEQRVEARERKKEAIGKQTRPTLFDFSTFGIDAYGIPVGTNKAPLQQPESDLRGNSIALDSPRPSFVINAPKLRHVARLSDYATPANDASAVDMDIDQVENPVPARHKAPLHRGGRPKKMRSQTQRKYDFWDSMTKAYEEPLLPQPSQNPSLNEIPGPSADLINTIHRFAAHHYEQHGQLYPKWPMPKKSRSRRTKPRQSDAQDGEDSGAEAEDADDTVRKPPKMAKPSFDDSTPSMHRAFDGTAAHAIGMIVQELVRASLSGAPPQTFAAAVTMPDTPSQPARAPRRYVSPSEVISAKRAGSKTRDENNIPAHSQRA
ncbi:hypothetical protein DL93DRAFT_2076092 [Clavulina sp. PMI_390]|nr:hypothetical protein DL93DRAFT_2076092 [Clavulina sp. PMI_390]